MRFLFNIHGMGVVLVGVIQCLEMVSKRHVSDVVPFSISAKFPTGNQLLYKLSELRFRSDR
jgi:hypothetical protein